MNKKPSSSPSIKYADLTKPASIQVQSVLFNNEFSAIKRAVASLARAAEIAISEQFCSEISLCYGDSSKVPCLTNTQLSTIQEIGQEFLKINYTFFDANLGSACGHNTLATNCSAHFLLIQNPDIVVSPRVFEFLLESFTIAGVGMVEAKQIPIEHPKDYDPISGETVWATTACAMVPYPLFHELNGFDAESFFLYCDDVDFSWKIREAGYKIIFQPAAVVFHDKRLSESGRWQSTSAEKYYSAEAALFLAYKWSRPDLVNQMLEFFKNNGDPNQIKAANVFIDRSQKKLLPSMHDQNHEIAVFNGIYYARHRYPL